MKITDKKFHEMLPSSVSLKKFHRVFGLKSVYRNSNIFLHNSLLKFKTYAGFCCSEVVFSVFKNFSCRLADMIHVQNAEMSRVSIMIFYVGQLFEVCEMDAKNVISAVHWNSSNFYE